MGTIKIRLIDTDVILNLILMQKRSNIHLGLGSPNETFNIITTDIVCQEVQSGINRAKKTKEYKNISINEDEIKRLERIWIEIKELIIIKSGMADPIRLRDRGEQSLVNLSLEYKNGVKIVSNNKKDVYKFLREHGISTKIHETPFEFYEEMFKLWFKDYKDVIKFMIIANNDFRVFDKNHLGMNILKRIK